MNMLERYFSRGIVSRTLHTVGMEVETQFVNTSSEAIHVTTSQAILGLLVKKGWSVDCRKGSLITALSDTDGNKIFYELGRHNIEVATTASTPSSVVGVAKKCLRALYGAAEACGAYPHFGPILEGSEDVLVVPDERDAVWLELDGRNALAPLARTSSVQCTISVSPMDAMKILNRLGEYLPDFLQDYPQDAVWKRYIVESSAGYRPDRYGGPLLFESLRGYCDALVTHAVVQGARLVAFSDAREVDIPLYLRSVWWHFRLKRYGDSLCIEVRPIPRKSDEHFALQLERVLHIFSL